MAGLGLGCIKDGAVVGLHRGVGKGAAQRQRLVAVGLGFGML